MSQWNEENRFNGWIDTPLAEGQDGKAAELARKIFKSQEIGAIYCSSLFRNMDTVARILEYDKKYPIFIHLDSGRMREWGNFKDLSDNDIPVYVSEKLSEKYYGKLQGLNKEEALKQYGEAQVRLWRRSWRIAPPGGECLKNVYKRAVPFFKKHAEKDLKEGKNVLIVASHNALRAIAKYIENISDDNIINFEIPYGGLVEYDLNESLTVKNKQVF